MVASERTMQSVSRVVVVANKKMVVTDKMVVVVAKQIQGMMVPQMMSMLLAAPSDSASASRLQDPVPSDSATDQSAQHYPDVLLLPLCQLWWMQQRYLRRSLLCQLCWMLQRYLRR